MALARATAVANEGAALFRGGDVAGADARFGDALDALSAALADATLGADDAAALALQRVVCLNNRAAAALRLGAPLRALDDSWDAVEAACKPEPRSRGHWRAPSREARDALASALVRRAAAFEAAGAPLGGLPGLCYAAQAVGASAVDKARAALAPLLEPSRPGGVPPQPGAAAGCAPARWERAALDDDNGTPAARCGAAAAVVDGFLYVFGGGLDNGGSPGSFPAATDLWRAPTARAGGLWERLPTPGKHGGPAQAPEAVLGASAARAELVVLALGALWALDCAALTWRCLGSPWEEASASRRADDAEARLRGAALAVMDGADGASHAFVYSPRAGLARVCLASGARALLHAPGSAAAWAAAPRCTAPLLWPCGTDALLLWGGCAPADAPDATRVEGHHLQAPPPLPTMWRFCLATRAWRRLPRDGGGCPPPPRAEAALAPLAAAAYEPGAAVLVGGYSEVLPVCMTMHGGPMMGYRYLSDAYLYTPSAGWRRLAPSGALPKDAAQRCVAFAPDEGDDGDGDGKGRVLVCGGYNGREACFPFDEVLALVVAPDAAACDAPAALAAAREAARAAALRLLRGGPFLQRTPPLPIAEELRATGLRLEHRPHARADWAALLGAALRLPPSGGAGSGGGGGRPCELAVTWQETDVGALRLRPPLYQLSVQGSDGALDTSSTDFYTSEPAAADVARQLVLSLVPAAAPGAPRPPPARRPVSVLFSARMGQAAVRGVAPLLELLGCTVVVETWAKTARCCAPHGTNPWGFNAAPRCVRCKRAGAALAQAGGGLRACATCRAARYCGAECQRDDWARHKEMCAVMAAFREDRQRGGGR
jgi:hypothetical protein